MEQLVIIKSVMEPKDYSTLRALLKKQQGERITPYIFKINNTQPVEDYLSQQRIDYEIYDKKEEKLPTDQELEKAYREISQDKERKKLTKSAQKAALKDLRKRL
jgi:alcohol dehydrogenase class IV